MLADWLSLISSEADFRWIKRGGRGTFVKRRSRWKVARRTLRGARGRCSAITTASEGLELGQQGVGTHNELGHAFTNVSTRRTIDRVPTLYLYTLFSADKRDRRETNGNFRTRIRATSKFVPTIILSANIPADTKSNKLPKNINKYSREQTNITIVN